jgi:hypothetical protein
VNLKVSAEDASWTVREAAWGVEEKVLWRGSDATKRVLDRARRRTAPLQRLIETRVTWPLADALRERGTAARAGLAAAAVAAVVAAGTAGALVAPNQDSPQPDTAAKLASATASATAAVPVLQGATPNFEVGDAKAAQAAAAAAPAELPSAPPARVAWQFADAFVRYEVGKLDERTAAGFAATATPPLAKSLSDEPPRLPAGTAVPKAKVLNVVLADRTPEQITASVSIVRLRTISEVRLSLQRTDDGWRVAGVLG